MMKRKITITSLAILLGSMSLFAQTNETKYRRSSMTMVLIEDEGLGEYKDQIVNAYEANPFPDKYNSHLIADKKFDASSMTLTDEDLIMSGFLTDTLKTPFAMIKAVAKLQTLRYVAVDSSVAVIMPNKRERLQASLDKYIREKGLARQMVSTWFNRKEDGSMDWELIKERGLYSASAEDNEDAETSADKSNLLFDFDLIGNTFVVFNKMQFFENEPVVAIIRDQAKIEAMKKLAGKPEILITKAMAAIDTLYERTKEGYTVKCNTFLYTLRWNKTVADGMMNSYFNNETNVIANWDTDTLMKLDFIGKTLSSSIVTFKIGETRTQEEIINLQVRRTMDNALAKLQKENVVFRPVAPITSTQPLTAKIGMKDGLEPGTKFEILESYKNELGLTEWKSVGKVSVDKKIPVWDNRQGAEPQLDEAGLPIVSPEFTTFKGGKKATVGINFIRQLK